jgi:hypothetical protein
MLTCQGSFLAPHYIPIGLEVGIKGRNVIETQLLAFRAEERIFAIPLANSENGTVQGAVATWRPRKSLPTKRQIATATCTEPIRQQYHSPPHSKGSAALSDFATAMSSRAAEPK